MLLLPDNLSLFKYHLTETTETKNRQASSSLKEAKAGTFSETQNKRTLLKNASNAFLPIPQYPSQQKAR